MGFTRVYLDGHACAGSLSWSLTAGSAPFVATVRMSNAAADALLGTGKAAAGTGGGGVNLNRPVTLTIEPNIIGRIVGAKGGEFKGVYVLHRTPSPSPKFASIVVADRRWLWTHAYYRRSLNVTRKVGTKRLTSPNQLDALNLEPRFAYARWSLRNKTELWRASHLLADLAAAIKTFERQETGVEPNVVLPSIPDDSPAQIPIQDLELDESLDAAIDRALAYLPGYAVTVDADGSVRFYSTTENDEAREIVAAGPEVQGRGHIEHVDYSRVRPRKIRVYASPEVELAWRFVEASDSGTTSDVDPGGDAMVLENVLPNPDPTAILRGQTITTGTYITMADAFTVWGNVPGLNQALTFQIVREAFVPYQNLWNAMLELGKANPRADWSARIGTLMQSYRQVFRLPESWVDRISDLRAYRVATINPERGTRGDASVFTDFAYVPSMRSLLAETLNDVSIGYVRNVAGYPPGGVVATDTIAAPARVAILDAEQGVFRVDYQADLFRMYEQTLPSQVELRGRNTQPGHVVAYDGAGPSPFLRRTNRPLGFNLLGQFDAPPQLTANHSLIAILTAVPGSPNGKSAMAYIDIEPKDVPDFPGRDRCFGPMMELRALPSTITARVAWDDNQRERIKAIFTDTSAPDPGDKPCAFSDLIVNFGEDSNGAGAASLKSVAKAIAARQYHAMRDRHVGSAAFAFKADGKVTGTTAAVTHDVGGAGEVTTRYDLPGRLAPLAIERFLPATAVKFLRRIINPGK